MISVLTSYHWKGKDKNFDELHSLIRSEFRIFVPLQNKIDRSVHEILTSQICFCCFSLFFYVTRILNK